MQLINEQARRWPDFQGGRPIELPDGQIWQFYEPEPMARPGDPDAAGFATAVPSWTFGPDVDVMLDLTLAYKFAGILTKWARAGRPKEKAAACLEAAWFLLARNYAVTVDEFEAILLEAAMWDDAEQAALGRELGRLLDDVLNRSLAHAAEAA